MKKARPLSFRPFANKIANSSLGEMSFKQATRELIKTGEMSVN